MMFLVGCTLVLVLQSSFAKPSNVSDVASPIANGQCGCTSDIQQLYAELRATQQRVSAIESGAPYLNSASDEPRNIDPKALYPDVIGFTVGLGTHKLDLPLGSTVLYDDIYYDAGNGYNPATGVFTCPRSGMYLFAIFVEAVRATPTALLQIKINNNPRIMAVSEPFSDTHDSTGGNILVEHINAGDRVWVETITYDNQELWNKLTTFSGVLIQNTQSSAQVVG